MVHGLAASSGLESARLSGRVPAVVTEVIDGPLTRAKLAEKSRRMCDDPFFANVTSKLEIDSWGSPPCGRLAHPR